MDFFVHDTLILALGILLDFRKAKKHPPSARVFITFFESLATSRCKNKCIMHGNPYGIPLMVSYLATAR